MNAIPNPRRRVLIPIVGLLVFAAAACGAAQAELGDKADDPIPVEPDGGIGDSPMPVEPDGGIGDSPMPVEPDGGIGDSPMPVEPDGGIGDSPMPVEPDGGIGDSPMPVEPDGGIGDEFPSEQARQEAHGLLGMNEDDLPADVRIGRRGAEQFALTEDYRLGRMTVELDNTDGSGFRVVTVMIELPAGPETFHLTPG